MTRLAPLALALVALAGPAAAAETILPGYWESTNRTLSPIRTTDVEKRCLTKADVEKFMMGPSNRRNTCTYPTKSAAGGRVPRKGT